jgi:hypothetical protein
MGVADDPRVRAWLEMSMPTVVRLRSALVAVASTIDAHIASRLAGESREAMTTAARELAEAAAACAALSPVPNGALDAAIRVGFARAADAAAAALAPRFLASPHDRADVKAGHAHLVEAGVAFDKARRIVALRPPG